MAGFNVVFDGRKRPQHIFHARVAFSQALDFQGTTTAVEALMRNCQTYILARIAGVILLGLAEGTSAEPSSDLKEALQEVRQQNAVLQRQLEQQQRTIDALSKTVSDMQKSTQAKVAQQSIATDDIQNSGKLNSIASASLGKVTLSGEGGVAFFGTGSDGQFPNNEFRLDEARLFLEAPVNENVFFYGELNLATREEPDVQARLGELYVDVENISQLWNGDHQLNARAGRLFIPFGEEYLTRYAIDNPFVSHSVSDLWGVDEGLEIYGRVGPARYTMAVQNGGISDTRDFTKDKSVAGRISVDPTRRLHLSVSGMRTGSLDSHSDALSAMWFGNGFFRSIGSAATTRFGAELAEGDLSITLPHGHVSAFGGYIHYHDNDPIMSNSRSMFYYSVEAVHKVVGKLYGAARFSQILADNGYPIAGDGDFGSYYFGALTRDLWRLSLDLGYRWSDGFVLKAEYTFEGGKTVAGESRDSEDLFALEAAFKF